MNADILIVEDESAIRSMVALALKQAGGNVSQAARLLGVTRDFMRYRLHGDRKPHESLGSGT